MHLLTRTALGAGLAAALLVAPEGLRHQLHAVDPRPRHRPHHHARQLRRLHHLGPEFHPGQREQEGRQLERLGEDLQPELPQP